MARWGKCDFKELKNLEKRLGQLDKADLDQFCRQMANDLAGRLLRKVIKRTVPGQIPPYATEEAKSKYWSGYTSGNLRDNWSVLPIEKRGERLHYHCDQQCPICVLCRIRPPTNAGALCPGPWIAFEKVLGSGALYVDNFHTRVATASA